MIKKTIKFKDYNEKEQTEDFHFNLSKGELVMMEMAAVDAETEGMTDKIERLMKSRNGKEIVQVFKDIIGLSYGIKTADGRFMKEDAEGRPLVVQFRGTGAYSELAFQLATDGEAGSDFINGLMPANLREEVRQQVAETEARNEKQTSVAPRAPQDYQKKQEKVVSSVEVLPDLPAAEDLAQLSHADLVARLQSR